MDHNILPSPHPNPWINTLHGYTTMAVDALACRGLRVHRSWLDPADPRDATILFEGGAARGEAGLRALVWDEVTGWRSGVFVSGKPGVRTVLTDVAHLGGGLVPGAGEVAWRAAAGVTVPASAYRSFRDGHDGLEDVLRAQHQLI